MNRQEVLSSVPTDWSLPHTRKRTHRRTSTLAHTHAHTHARTCARTRAHKLTDTRARARERTRTHIHIHIYTDVWAQWNNYFESSKYPRKCSLPYINLIYQAKFKVMLDRSNNLQFTKLLENVLLRLNRNSSAITVFIDVERKPTQ